MTMSTDQARTAFLVVLLAKIADQRQKLSLEMAAIRGMTRELAVKATSQVQTAAADRRIDQRLGRNSKKPLCLSDEIQPKHFAHIIPTANGGIILPLAASNVAFALLRTERPVKSQRKVPSYESNTVTQDAPRRSFAKMVQ